ncbi:MAG: hypothetical protein HXS53_09565 [Theionarchaea archaeon]|nr:hypothetical protein [Theionarchaea archaeon]
MLAKIGLIILFLGILCYIVLFISLFIAEPGYKFEFLVLGFFGGVVLGIALMFISALYDRYKQLKTEQIHPKV